jgi:hypothetical protein
MTPRKATRRRLPARQQLTTAEKGYGIEHKRLREKVKRTVDAGSAVCWRCGRPIHPAEHWDLGHHDGPAAKALRVYRGPEHRYCSRSAGAYKKQHRAGTKTSARTAAARPTRALAFFDTRQ